MVANAEDKVPVVEHHDDHEKASADPFDPTLKDPNVDFVELAAREVHYGYTGVRALFSSPYVFGAALLASMGGFSYGYDQGVISLILVMPQFRDHYPEVDPSHPHYGFNTGFMTGMLVLGGFLGCLAYPYAADRLSRKWALSIAVVFFDVGASEFACLFPLHELVIE
jgi:hypothetical protein